MKIGPYEIGQISANVLCPPKIEQEGTMTHEPKEMKRVDKYPKHHTGQTGRRWAVWHSVYRCECGKTKSHLSNVMRGRMFICDGEKVKLVSRNPPPTTPTEGAEGNGRMGE